MPVIYERSWSGPTRRWYLWAMQTRSAPFRNRVASLEKIYLSFSLSTFLRLLVLLSYLSNVLRPSPPLSTPCPPSSRSLSRFSITLVRISTLGECQANSLLYISSLLASWFVSYCVVSFPVFRQDRSIEKGDGNLWKDFDSPKWLLNLLRWNDECHTRREFFLPKLQYLLSFR